MNFERKDLFMTTLDPKMGFELGDFVKKKHGGKVFKSFYYRGEGGNIDASIREFNNKILVASLDRRLYKLDPKTGKKIWEFKAGGYFGTGGPEVHNSRVYIGNYDHNFYCIDFNTGKEIWRFKTGDVISSSPLLVKDMVIFPSHDYFVYALDIKTSKMLWAFRTGGWTNFSPVSDGENIFIASSDGNLYCLDFEGREKWRFTTGGNMFTKEQAPIVDGVIYFGSDDCFIYGLDIKTGREVWRFKTGGMVNRPPVISDGKMYILSHDGYFYCIDMETRKELWRFKTSSDEGGTKALILKDRIIFCSADYNVYCLDKNGKLLWKFRTGGHIWSTPLFYKGKLYVGSYDCRLYCMDIEGNVEWRFETSNLNQALCIIENGTTMEFKPPEITGEKEEREEKYETKTQTGGEDAYKVQSEYVFKSEYKQESEYK